MSGDRSTGNTTNHNQLSNLDKLEVTSFVTGPVVPEILAPVGGREQFFAALNAGADAVFLGLKQFNARARAENFTVDELRSLVPLAHRYGMKVLVTLNILIKDIELPDLVDTLAALEDVGVHAIIVQDLGVAAIVRKHFPGLRLHASTQMAVHNLAGVQKAYEWGFKRVVLARELTAQEIKRIRAAVPKELVELEVFCHGSLCYSYSGLCFFSGAADARSGNRGECAYTCREPYKVVSEPGQGFLFSMKDLDTAHKLNLMVEAGVDTLKIEGRKKDAQYVTSVVRLYRKKLNDLFGRDTLRASAPPLAHDPLNLEAEIRKDLALSFQRRTTSFFFEGRYHENVIDLDSPTHHGIRAGVIEKIIGRTLHIRLEQPLERFDGVKILPPAKVFHAKPQDGDAEDLDSRDMKNRYANKEIAFSVRDMAMKGRWLPEAHAGMLIEIEQPNDVRIQPQTGDLVFKTRSDALRRNVEKLTKAPVDARLRPLQAVTAAVDAVALADGGLRVAVQLNRLGEIVASEAITLQEGQERQKGDLATDLKDALGIFGDSGVYVEEFIWNLPKNYFVPRSSLKELKKLLEQNLAERCAAVSRRHRAEALTTLSEVSIPLEPVTTPQYAVKIDRLDYLTWLDEVIDLGLMSHVCEVVFEPKKMFLQTLLADEFLTPLKKFSAKHGVKIRIAIPTVIRAWDEPVLKKWLEACESQGIAAYEVGNVGALAQLRSWDLNSSDVSSDFMLYGLNRLAVKFWQEQGLKSVCLSIEDDWTDLQSLLGAWPEGVKPTAILYKDTPLFVAESCSLTALHNGCPTAKVCGYRSLEIENSKGERFIVAHEGCKSIVFGKTAYSISGQRHLLQAAGVAQFRIDFLTRAYDETEFKKILQTVASDTVVDRTHSANFCGTLK